MEIVLTIVFSVIALMSVLFFFLRGLFREYKVCEKREQRKMNVEETNVVTEDDFKKLPSVLQKYLRYVGVVGKPKVQSFKVTGKGQMKMDERKPAAPVRFQQHSFNRGLTRYFYLAMKFMRLPIYGLHRYDQKQAQMFVKVLGVIPVVNVSGDKMNKAETVTLFNDICLMAPAALLNEQITWEEFDAYSVRGIFRKNEYSVSATLRFDAEGKLINFVSDDRFYLDSNGEMISYRWSTPIHQYKRINGYNLAAIGDAVWHKPDGYFKYFSIDIEDVRYNV